MVCTYLDEVNIICCSWTENHCALEGWSLVDCSFVYAGDSLIRKNAASWQLEEDGFKEFVGIEDRCLCGHGCKQS